LQNDYRIILARHGENEDNANQILAGTRDTPLTKKGKEQAHQLAKQLIERGLPIKWVFSGHSLRGCETALICATDLRVPHTIIASIVERDHGILEGRHSREIPRFAKAWKEVDGETFVVDVPGGESHEKLCIRAKEVLADIHFKARMLNIQDDILVVGHGALNKAILVNHRNLSWQDVLHVGKFSNCGYVILE